MPELNANIPQFECFVRDEFLYNFKQGNGDFTRGVCHAISTIPSRAIGFHVLLDNGAHIGRLPIHALVRKKDAPVVSTEKPWELQLWDCFSVHNAVTVFDWLKGMRVRVTLPDKKSYGGNYMFTIDYHGSRSAEAAGDAGWKCHHIIELDNGLLVAQPNNRVCWFESSSVVPFEVSSPPRYKTMETEFSCEDGDKWRCSDDDKMFYSIEVKTTKS